MSSSSALVRKAKPRVNPTKSNRCSARTKDNIVHANTFFFLCFLCLCRYRHCRQGIFWRGLQRVIVTTSNRGKEISNNQKGDLTPCNGLRRVCHATGLPNLQQQQQPKKLQLQTLPSPYLLPPTSCPSLCGCRCLKKGEDRWRGWCARMNIQFDGDRW